MRYLLTLGTLFLVVFPSVALAQELVPETQTLMKARVVEVISEEVQTIPGTGTTATYQTIRVSILSGPQEGREVVVENDFLTLKEGEVFYLRHVVSSIDGIERYTVVEPYRLPWVLGFLALFVLAVLLVGGWQGIRGLLALIGGLALIIYALFPAILGGVSPILAAMAVASVIVTLGSYVTHGFNKTTSAAVLGMLCTILISGALAFCAVYLARLSGFSSEEAVYLNINTGGALDFSGLLLAGILIGLLGVLYDAAIGQAVSIDELRKAGPHLSRGYLFARAMRIGREHIGALVNTLAIAYVGVSLPLLLLVYSSGDAGLEFLLNQELFATEIIRTAIGSLGLVLAVPITTLVAVMLLHRDEGGTSEQEAAERTRIEQERSVHGHLHG